MINPQVFLSTMLRQQNNNPVVNNAMNMFQSGNSSGLEQLARNLCKSKGIDPDEALRNAQRLFNK